jgi:hypothetical protein
MRTLGRLGTGKVVIKKYRYGFQHRKCIRPKKVRSSVGNTERTVLQSGWERDSHLCQPKFILWLGGLEAMKRANREIMNEAKSVRKKLLR